MNNEQPCWPCYRNWEVHFTFKRDEPTPKKQFEVRRYLLSSLVWKTLAMVVPCRCLQPHATQLTPVGTDFPRICVGSGDTYLWQIKIDKEDKENGLCLSRPYKSILFVCSGTYSLPSITDISLQNRTSNHVNKLCGCLWRREREGERQGGWSPQSQQHNQCNGQSELEPTTTRAPWGMDGWFKVFNSVSVFNIITYLLTRLSFLTHVPIHHPLT
jgi:hypothetical protein